VCVEKRRDATFTYRKKSKKNNINNKVKVRKGKERMEWKARG
jgi:hypothetical protein